MVDKDYIKIVRDFFDSDTKSAKLTKIALILVAIPVIVGGAVFIGNAVKIFKMFDKKKHYTTKQITNAVSSLKRQKMIEYVSEKDGITTLKITKKGKSVLKHFSIDIIRINKPKKWDEKWRLVMFDLPIRFSKARDALRFVQFQKSAWVYPYHCEEEILFIADYFKVEKYLEILEVSNIKDDQSLKKYFKLV